MKEVKKPSGYWTKERCKKEAKKYNTRSNFEKGSGGAYGAAHKKGWLEEYCKHMPKIAKRKATPLKNKKIKETLLPPNINTKSILIAAIYISKKILIVCL